MTDHKPIKLKRQGAQFMGSDNVEFKVTNFNSAKDDLYEIANDGKGKLMFAKFPKDQTMPDLPKSLVTWLPAIMHLQTLSPHGIKTVDYDTIMATIMNCGEIADNLAETLKADKGKGVITKALEESKEVTWSDLVNDDVATRLTEKPPKVASTELTQNVKESPPKEDSTKLTSGAAYDQINEILKKCSKSTATEVIKMISGSRDLVTKSSFVQPPAAVQKSTTSVKQKGPKAQISRKSPEAIKLAKDIKDVNKQISAKAGGSKLDPKDPLILLREQLFREKAEPKASAKEPTLPQSGGEGPSGL